MTKVRLLSRFFPQITTAELQKNYMADFMGGIGFVFKRFKVSYAYVFRTKQFDTQEKAQVFGTFTFSLPF